LKKDANAPAARFLLIAQRARRLCLRSPPFPASRRRG